MKQRLRIVVLTGFAITLGARAQMPMVPIGPPDAPPTVQKVPQWDVISVKPHKSDDGMITMGTSSDGMRFVNLPLSMVLQQAYGLYNSSDDRITGLPGWSKTVRYDIEGKVSPDDVATFQKLTAAQRAEMLRTLLADRFALKAHMVTTDQPVYALVLAKGGDRLTPVAAPTALDKDGKPMHTPTWSTSHGGFEASDSKVSFLVSMLTQASGRTVIDRTGLTGWYDYKLNWTPNDVADSNAADSGKAAAPPLFTALQEQLGLRLDPSRGPVEGLVIDKIEMPSAN